MASQNDTDLPIDHPDAIHALISSFIMIIFSEIGDKTFLLAAILAMRHPRLAVFAGALAALALMSLLSAQLGHLLPALLPRQWTQAAAAILFLGFGVKMFQEGREMASGNEKLQEEMREAEEDIEGDDAAQDGTGTVLEDGGVIPLEDLEGGTRVVSTESRGSNGDAKRVRSRSTSSTRMCMESVRNFFSLFLGPVFVQSFVLTFLGEWGDRSQISTIALGAAHNVYVVALGTIVGHGLCTTMAVMGGRYISTKISVKHVTLAGSMLFILFGLIYMYEAFHGIDPESVSDLNPLS